MSSSLPRSLRNRALQQRPRFPRRRGRQPGRREPAQGDRRQVHDSYGGERSRPGEQGRPALRVDREPRDRRPRDGQRDGGCRDRVDGRLPVPPPGHALGFTHGDGPLLGDEGLGAARDDRRA